MPFLTTDKRFWDDRAVTLKTVSTLNGGTLDVTVYQDVYGDGFPDKQTTKSLTGGTETFSLDPFVRAKRADYWMKFEATGSPTLDSANLVSGKSNTIDWTSDADWRRSASSSGFTQDDLGDHPSDDFFQRGYDYGSVTRGLVAYYPFDDDWDRDPVRDKALSNDGRNNGANYVSGQIRSAGDFNGSSDEIDIGEIGSYSSHTVSAWVNLSNISVGNAQHIVTADRAEGTSVRQFQFREGSGNWEYIFFDSGETEQTLSSPATTGWTHVLATHNGSGAKLFVDGVEVDSLSGSIISRNPYIKIGRRQAEYLDGQIDEVRIYDRALSAPEIERLANMTEPSTITPSDTL